MLNRKILSLIRPHVVELIDVLNQIEQISVQELELSTQDIIAEIQAYGLDIGEIVFANFDDEQLLAILEALRQMGSRFIELAQECDNVEMADDIAPEQYFQQLFDRPIKTFYDIDADFTKVGSTETRHDLIFAPSAFENDEGRYTIETIKEIVIHEFGHIFHNELGFVEPIASSSVTIEKMVDPEGNIQTDFEISITSDTPQVVIDYLIATGGYYAGDVGFEYGQNRNIGVYRYKDVGESGGNIIPLTRSIMKVQ